MGKLEDLEREVDGLRTFISEVRAALLAHHLQHEAGGGDPVDLSGYVAKTLFDANTILKADSDNVPLALAVAASRIVGRKSTGNIAALTGGEIHTILNPPRCRLRNLADQSIPNNTNTAVTFNAEIFDTDSMHDTGSNTERITFTTAGVYLIHARIHFDDNSNGYRSIRIQHSVDGLLGQEVIPLADEGTLNWARGGWSLLWDCLADEYVWCEVYQNSGVALDILNHNLQAPSFSAIRVA